MALLLKLSGQGTPIPIPLLPRPELEEPCSEGARVADIRILCRFLHLDAALYLVSYISGEIILSQW